jgi:deoxyribodipyrimidine photo-lyase
VEQDIGWVLSASLVWFRNDLRLADNPALIAGLGSGRPVIPVYILDEETPGIRPMGAASRWWLHHSLHSLDASLRTLGSRLILRRGPAERVIEEISTEYNTTAVYWNRAYDRGTRERDARLKQSLNVRGVAAEGLKGNLLFEPWEVKTAVGTSFKVFSAFWRACRELPSPGATLPAPRALPAPPHWSSSDAPADWTLLPTAPDWAGGLRASWTPGEAAASRRLAAFLDSALANYRQARDLPAVPATSRLSPHLAFGEISPRQIWRAATTRGMSAASEKFLTELGWREFSYHLLFHHGDLGQRNFRRNSIRFPGSTMKTRSMPGAGAGRATRSSTPACASCGPPAGCTIACA